MGLLTKSQFFVILYAEWIHRIRMDNLLVPRRKSDKQISSLGFGYIIKYEHCRRVLLSSFFLFFFLVFSLLNLTHFISSSDPKILRNKPILIQVFICIVREGWGIWGRECQCHREMININSTGTPQQTYKTSPPSEGKNRYLKYYYHLKNHVQIGVRPLP